ncbi:MAG TPA: cyclic nucleotide-binding domain-containing protein, partial [Spirochaetota bacterium]|nr:cyclic nucleotide-binding domain-containing protein [Spirochaetota bacterium]
QVADPKYRSKVILLLETAGTCSGMALGGFFTFLTTKDFFSITALNFVSVALLLIVLILWFFGYRGFFKTLQNNICEIKIGNINEIVGKNVSPYMERFLSDNLLNGTTPTKIITLDLIKEIEIKNKKNLILDSFKNGDISYKYKIIDYIFDKNSNINDLYSYLEYVDGVKSYFIYNLFVNYRFIFKKKDPIFFEKINRLFCSSDEKNNRLTNNNEDNIKDKTPLNSFPKNSETDEITLNFIFNPNEESFLKISDYLFDSNDKISILKLLRAIKNFPDFYKNSKPFIIKIYDKYFSDVDIMIQISSLISVYDDFDILKRFSEKFYHYEIINAIKIDCKNIFDILSKDNFLSNLYILSIASKSGKSKESERFFEIALKVTDKLHTICAEETKIRRYFEKNKSMILIDEIAEIKNTALSVLINFLLYYYNVLQIENIYNLLKSGEKEDYITDILQNVIPRNLNLKLKNIIKNDCKNINEEDFNYDVLKLGIENEALFSIYRYLGGVKMGEEVQNKLEKLITLKNIPLFEELNIDSLLLISSISEYADYEENRIVVNEGDSSDKFFVIIRGEVAVTKGEKELAVLKSGEIFGEMGVIDDAIRTATIKTKVKTLFLEIDGKNFVDLLKRYGSISFSVIRTISERLRTLLGKLK